MKRFCILFMAFLTTLALMEALKPRLAALEIEPGKAVFQEVRFSAKKNYLEAILELQVANTDVCLIHPVGEHYESERSGGVQTTKQFHELLLLIGTQDLSATTGEMLATPQGPGILAMKDAVLRDRTAKPCPGIVGANLGLGSHRVCLVPVASTLTELTWEEKGAEVAGRQVWQILLRTPSGISTVQPG